MRKEAQKTGFVHLCESDAASVLGLSLEWLWIRLQPQERMNKIRGTMENSITRWLEATTEVSIFKRNLIAIKGSVAPQVTSWTMARIDSSSSCCVSKREKASTIEKAIRKYLLAGSKTINLGSIYQKIHSARVKNIKTALKFPKYFPVLWCFSYVKGYKLSDESISFINAEAWTVTNQHHFLFQPKVDMFAIKLLIILRYLALYF